MAAFYDRTLTLDSRRCRVLLCLFTFTHFVPHKGSRCFCGSSNNIKHVVTMRAPQMSSSPQFFVIVVPFLLPLPETFSGIVALHSFLSFLDFVFFWTEIWGIEQRERVHRNHTVVMVLSLVWVFECRCKRDLLSHHRLCEAALCQLSSSWSGD